MIAPLDAAWFCFRVPDKYLLWLSVVAKRLHLVAWDVELCEKARLGRELDTTGVKAGAEIYEESTKNLALLTPFKNSRILGVEDELQIDRKAGHVSGESS